MAKPIQLSLVCRSAADLAAFWASALDYEIVRVIEGGERALLADPAGVGPRLLLHRVPEKKTVKNRLHLDVIVSGWGTPPAEAKPIVDAEAERLSARGATPVRTTEKPYDYFIVMTDPEGNEFCIV